MTVRHWTHKPSQERAGSVIELVPGKSMSDNYKAKYIPSISTVGDKPSQERHTTV